MDLFYFRSNAGKKAASKEDKGNVQLARSSTSPSKASTSPSKAILP